MRIQHKHTCISTCAHTRFIRTHTDHIPPALAISSSISSVTASAWVNFISLNTSQFVRADYWVAQINTHSQQSADQQRLISSSFFPSFLCVFQYLKRSRILVLLTATRESFMSRQAIGTLPTGIKGKESESETVSSHQSKCTQRHIKKGLHCGETIQNSGCTLSQQLKTTTLLF